MRLAIDLLIAAALTVSVGTAMLWAERVLAPAVLLAGVVCSVATGLAWLWRRQRERFIPIASVFIVTMLAVLVYIGFRLALRRGPVEF